MRVTTSCSNVPVGTSSPELSNWARRWDCITHLFIRIMPQLVGMFLLATVQRIRTDYCRFSESMIQMESFRVCSLDISSCRYQVWSGNVNRWNFSDVLEDPRGTSSAVCFRLTAYSLSTYKQVIMPRSKLELGPRRFWGVLWHPISSNYMLCTSN
jgi:hypothetical protein